MLLAMIVLYAPWMGRGYVNLEYPFSMAARALSDSQYAAQMDVYFANQANPLGYSFVLAIIYKIFGYHDWFWLAKLPSLCGGLMIIVSGWILTRDRWHDRRSFFYFWSSLIILHPMIIAFGTAATADVLPVGLLMLALAIAMKPTDNEIGSKFVAALLFGFAIIVKYNTVYFGGAFLFVAIVGEYGIKRTAHHVRRDVLIFISVPFVILASYVWWSYDRYGVFISNRLTKHRPNFLDFSSFLWTSSKYFVFLGIFSGPISLCIVLKIINRTRRRLIIVLIFVSANFGWFISFLRIKGEMNFGKGFPANHYFLRTLEATGMVFGLCFLIILFSKFIQKDRLSLFLFCGFVPYFVLISFSLPIQRYLIFVVPIVLLLLVDASKDLSVKLRNLALGLTVLAFAAVSLLGMSYLRAQGNASEHMAVWMETNHVIGQSSASPIGMHAGQHFYGLTSTEIKYEVIQTSLDGEKLIRERILHREPMNVLDRITRVYVLRELPKAP